MTIDPIKTRVIENKKLSEITTFGLGGPALFYIEVSTIDEMKEAFRFASDASLPFLLVGRGSNMLCHDQGFRGVAIHNKIQFLEQREEEEFLIVNVGGGYNFSLLGTQTARLGFGGLEFASGIPASVGGAVFMNAGANGTETCDVLQSVTWLDEGGELHHFPREELSFSYRHSPFQNMRGAVIAATFKLKRCESARSKQISIIQTRKTTQPLKEMSAGCIFRNPPKNFAGALIDQCGLKGLEVGGAKVSEIHGNFIVNTGTAKSEDVDQLITLIQERVKEKTGFSLESEVRRIPYHPEEDHV